MSAPEFPVDATVALLDDESRTTTPRDTKQRSTLLTVCPFILGNEFCERLAFYGYVPIVFALRQHQAVRQYVTCTIIHVLLCPGW